MASVTDFLPKYPYVEKSKINPYGKENFNDVLFRKKEFYENKLNKIEYFPKERGSLTKYQKTVARYLSLHTPYDRLLLVHAPGLGKTCSAIGVVEQIIADQQDFEKKIYTGALILAKGKNLLDNFMTELLEKCTRGQYYPDNYIQLTENEKVHRIKAKTRFYKLQTFEKFAKALKKMRDEDIVETYSNKIIIIDEAHNLRIQKDKTTDVEVYNQFFRFLHLVVNCKVLLLTGTPMKDSPAEIASISNLLLPLDKQFPTEEDFLTQYMIENNGTYVMKQDMMEKFKKKIKGIISFLREPESSVPKKFLGKKMGTLKHFTVFPTYMSSFQTKGYSKAYTDEKETKKGVFTDSREASLFVYPDGSFGKAGFEKYIQEGKSSTFSLSPKLREALTKGGNSRENILNNLRKFSSTYAAVIEKIINTKGNCFVYSSIVRGSGAILFSLVLELFGFSKATSGKETTKELRYAILTHNTVTIKQIRKLNYRFNKEDNVDGDYIKVIIGSKAVSEGFSFNNVVFECILTPHWNYSETAQAIARGIRYGSHNILINRGEKPVVQIMQPVAIPENSIRSIDLYMYQTSEDKDVSIRGILRLLMEAAFDCALNYLQNKVEGVSGSRDCDYQSCEFKCDGVPLFTKLSDEKLDYSTYQLYYSNPKIPAIKRRIEQIIRDNKKIEAGFLAHTLRSEFTAEEIRNALFFIGEAEDISYLEYLDNTPSKFILKILENLFKTSFIIEYSTIRDAVNQENKTTDFEILSTLRSVITENIKIVNSYGASCYLRENQNFYYLVEEIELAENYLVSYYTSSPFSRVMIDFDNIIDYAHISSVPPLIKRICKDKEPFEEVAKLLPENIQRMFLEYAIIAKKSKVDIKKEIIESVLKYFKSYIYKIDKTYFTTFQKKIRKLQKRVWVDADETEKKMIQEKMQEVKKELKTANPYGIAGLFNPENSAFCLVDFSKEPEKATKDKRLVRSGKVCTKGWPLYQLMDIAILKLKIPCPDTFRQDDDISSLKKICKTDKELKKILSEEFVNNADIDTLRRAVYWGTRTGGGKRGIAPLCEAINSFLKKEGLIEIDNQCGSRGKVKELVKTEKKQSFRVEFITAKKEALSPYIKMIDKLYQEVYSKKITLEYGKDIWVLVFIRKKLVGFLSTTDGKEIKLIAVAKNYKRRGIAKDAVKEGIKVIQEQFNQEPIIKVNNKEASSKKIIKLYTEYGFKVTRTDETYTYMSIEK